MSRIIILVFAFFTFGISYSQMQRDTTTTNYVWSFDPVFDEPTQKEAYNITMKYPQYGTTYHSQVKKILSKYLNRFDKKYSSEMLASLMAGIIQSDVVLLDHPSKFVYEFQYGNYQGGGFGIQTVGCYTHCLIDISQHPIVPQFHISITY